MKQRAMALLAEVARTGSVTAAAASLRMSQPAASSMIRQLEEQLGFELFTREKRHLELSNTGRALLPEIFNALSAIDSVNRMADSMRGGAPQRLVIGAVAAVGASVLPQAVCELQREFPNAAVVVRAGLTLEIVEMAMQHHIDLGIIVNTGVHPLVGYQALSPLRLFCVMRADDAYAAFPEVTIQDLARSRYIAHSRHLQIGAVTARRLEEAGFDFRPALEVMQFSAACAFVEAGAGIAVLESVSALYAQRHGLVAVPLRADSDLSLDCVWRLGREPSPLVRALLQKLSEAVAALP
jgi:DNA-binding transcriptional LysR family regulator